MRVRVGVRVGELVTGILFDSKSDVLVIGGCILIALIAVAFSEETFGRDLILWNDRR